MANSKKVKKVYICPTCRGNGYVKVACIYEKEDMVHLYVDTTVSDKAISCFINTTKEQLYREVKENKWFLEEVILKFCKFIQAEKRDEAGFVEKLRAYLDSERSNMPEILKIAIENKIYQADMMAAMEG